MKIKMVARPSLSMLAGLSSVIPFIAMEFVNGGFSRYGFPLILFVALWLVASFFFYSLSTGVNMIRFPDRPARKALGILVLSSSIFFAWFWIMVVIDQMPCFLGIANCD